MPVIIRGLSGLSKKIKDATATPADIISGKVAYGNDHTRMLGTHVCQPKIETITLKKGQEVNIPSPEGAECCYIQQRVAQFEYPNRDDATIFFMVYGSCDNTAIWDPESMDSKTQYTFLKKIKVNVRYCPDSYLILKVNNIPLYIRFGRPILNERFVDPGNFSEKVCGDFLINADADRSIIKYAGPGTTSGYYSSAGAEIYLDIKNGIITEMGIAIRAYYPNVNKYYSEDDIGLSIVYF